VHGIDIGFRINGNGFDAEFTAGTDDPEGNFPSVSDQNFFEHGERGGK
jgi:hypothetical protein